MPHSICTLHTYITDTTTCQRTSAMYCVALFTHKHYRYNLMSENLNHRCLMQLYLHTNNTDTTICQRTSVMNYVALFTYKHYKYNYMSENLRHRCTMQLYLHTNITNTTTCQRTSAIDVLCSSIYTQTLQIQPYVREPPPQMYYVSLFIHIHYRYNHMSENLHHRCSMQLYLHTNITDTTTCQKTSTIDAQCSFIYTQTLQIQAHVREPPPQMHYVALFTHLHLYHILVETHFLSLLRKKTVF